MSKMAKAKVKKKKKPKGELLCCFLVQVPEPLRLSFKKAYHKQRITARAAITLFMQAVLTREITFNRTSLKINKVK